MVDIIIFSHDTSGRFSKLLAEQLSPYYKVAIWAETAYIRQTEDIDFLIMETASLAQITSEQGVLIFTDTAALPSLSLAGNIVAILNSADKSGLQATADNKIKAITCGLSSKDTLTVSSISDSDAVVSLQRNITSFAGAVIEPAEFPIALREGYSVGDMLMLTALIFLIDKDRFLC